jgi:hypothetical protein
MRPEVLTLGEAMAVLYPAVPVPLDQATSLTLSIAGAEAHVAIALSRLGQQVRFLSRLGDDPFGRLIRHTLRAEGVETSYVLADPSAPTGVFFREWLADGLRRSPPSVGSRRTRHLRWTPIRAQEGDHYFQRCLFVEIFSGRDAEASSREWLWVQACGGVLQVAHLGWQGSPLQSGGRCAREGVCVPVTGPTRLGARPLHPLWGDAASGLAISRPSFLNASLPVRIAPASSQDAAA